jgi:hypothetical protein
MAQVAPLCRKGNIWRAVNNLQDRRVECDSDMRRVAEVKEKERRWRIQSNDERSWRQKRRTR